MRNLGESIFFFFLDNQAESHAHIDDGGKLNFCSCCTAYQRHFSRNFSSYGK